MIGILWRGSVNRARFEVAVESVPIGTTLVEAPVADVPLWAS